MLYHLSYCSTNDILRQTYYSLVETYIRHGVTAWGSSTHCRILQNTQNQILKNILKNSHFLNRTYSNNHPIQNNSNNIQRNTPIYTAILHISPQYHLHHYIIPHRTQTTTHIHHTICKQDTHR